MVKGGGLGRNAYKELWKTVCRCHKAVPVTVIAAKSRTNSTEKVLRMRIWLPIHENVLWNGCSVIFGRKILDHSMAHNAFAEMEVIGLYCGRLAFRAAYSR